MLRVVENNLLEILSKWQCTTAMTQDEALNTEQTRVYEWLNSDLSLPVFAEAYKGAAVLLSQKPAGYISFVAHTGRDLMNRLASTVAGIKSDRVQYQQHIDKLQSDWRDEWRFSDDLSPEVVEKDI